MGSWILLGELVRVVVDTIIVVIEGVVYSLCEPDDSLVVALVKNVEGVDGKVTD